MSINSFKKFTLLWVVMLALSLTVTPLARAYANEEAPAKAEGGEGEGEGDHNADGGGKGMKAGGYMSPYLEFQQMNVVGMYRGEPVLHMNYIFVVEMINDEEFKYVSKNADAVRSAFVEELHKLGSVQRGAVLKNYDYLKRHLAQIANKVIGPNAQGNERVRSVLIKATAGRSLT
jgi:hypothetical protein